MTTPSEGEAMQDIADQVRNESAKTGRDVREILEAMRDEGYIGCSDEELERCAMTTFALASEYDKLTPEQRAQVDHILLDDGEWTREMIALAIQFPLERIDHEDDWSRP